MLTLLAFSAVKMANAEELGQQTTFDEATFKCIEYSLYQMYCALSTPGTCLYFEEITNQMSAQQMQDCDEWANQIPVCFDC